MCDKTQVVVENPDALALASNTTRVIQRLREEFRSIKIADTERINAKALQLRTEELDHLIRQCELAKADEIRRLEAVNKLANSVTELAHSASIFLGGGAEDWP
jgi:hypothetical protein